MTYDAVSIENSFARLTGTQIGARGKAHDADFFRSGNLKSIGKALINGADAMEKRLKAIKFEPEDYENGGIKTRLDSYINRLRRLATHMTALKTKEPEDYHWEIVGCLIGTIDALLSKLEK